jgi:K+-sensing histidine kinase KdpD
VTPAVGTTTQRWLLWLAALATVTGLLLLLRDRLAEVHVALVFLLVVLGASAAGGRRLGLLVAGAAFILFDVGFIPPYGRFHVDDPFDWIVLAAFLVTGMVAAELLERKRREAEVARARAAEIDRLGALGAEADALRRMDRLKDALLTSVSHDLRTPLTTIKGIANEIARGGDTSRAHVIEEEVDRLTALVDDLLDLSQLDAGEMTVRAAVNTADDVIGAVLQRVESAFPGCRVETRLEHPWTDLVGRFDFRHTMRILTNVLENAAKYAPPGTTIRLRAWREDAELRFAVEDAGPGISEEDRERIFEPFVRGRATSHGIRGTGLGLSIGRRLAEVQGGRLTYEPTSEAASRFVLSVPAAEVPAMD